MVTISLPASDPATIALAVALIADGQPIAIPTETVYGLAADATNGEAVARIYEAKGRPSFNPLIVHTADLRSAEAIARFDGAARGLAAVFWPGPLTLVLPLRDDHPLASLVTAGLPTVALRVPAHPVMQRILVACGRPLAAPSANASGRISPTRAPHVVQSLGDRIALVIDGGATEHGLESTIVRPEAGRIVVLRPGPITVAMIEAASKLPVIETADPAITAPGQLAAHYAPAKPLRLDVTAAAPGEWLIGFGDIGGDANLSASASLLEAAARLFDLLHQADRSAPPRIAVAPIPSEGIGVAIRDRLRRAATGSGQVDGG